MPVEIPRVEKLGDRTDESFQSRPIMDVEWERLCELRDEIKAPTRFWDAVGFCFLGVAGGAVFATIPLLPVADVVKDPASWLLPAFIAGGIAALVIGLLSLWFARQTRATRTDAAHRLDREMQRVERGWAARQRVANDQGRIVESAVVEKKA